MDTPLVGSLVTPSGIRPFSFFPAQGILNLDEYAPQAALPDPESIRHLAALVRAIANVPVQEVRFGQYFCHVCGQWIEATRGRWSLSICMSCSLDRDSELWDYYSDAPS